MFVRNDLAEKKIKRRRLSSKNFLDFKEKPGLDPYKCYFDEQHIICALQLAFEGSIMDTQYYVLGKKLDLYFPKYKLAIEIDEYAHVDRNYTYEQCR